MTTNYYCDLDSDASPDEIAARLQALIGGTIDTGGKFLRVIAGALDARIITETDPNVREWFREDWGLDSKISVGFTLDESLPEGEQDAGHRNFSVASARLGEDLNADAILRFEGNRLMMRRQNGALTLYDWWPDWTHPEVIAKLPPGYTISSDGQDTPERQTSGA
jgi:hypothetical protein